MDIGHKEHVLLDEKFRYVIFETEWGFFGLLGNEKGLLRSCLPIASRSIAETNLLVGISSAGYNPTWCIGFQGAIKAYFEGQRVDFFEDIKVRQEGKSQFDREIMGVCRKIGYGKTVSYGELAKSAGREKAVRAVGGALGRNRLPLIIPCHRVICANGQIGGFSAEGGVKLKERMLELEQSCR